LPQSLLAVPDLPLPMQSQNTAVKIAEAIETSRLNKGVSVNPPPPTATKGLPVMSTVQL